MRREEPAWIEGPLGKLFAIIHHASDRSDPSPCIIMLNAGFISRVGPQRLYVTAARRWADDGITCLRVDLAGVGDSQAENDTVHFDGHFPEEVIAIVNYSIRELRATSVYLVGLCAGARVAIKAAAQCKGVTGVIAWSCPTLSSSPLMPSSPFEEKRSISDWKARRTMKQLAEAILQLKFVRPSWWLRPVDLRAKEIWELLLAVNRFIFRTEVRGNPFLDVLDTLLSAKRNVFFVFGERDQLPVGDFLSVYAIVPNSTEQAQAYHVVPNATHTFNAASSQQSLISVSTEWLRARMSTAGSRADKALQSGS